LIGSKIRSIRNVGLSSHPLKFYQQPFPMKILNFFILLFLISCKNNIPPSNHQTLDFGEFSIETPKGWTKIDGDGVDSYTGKIAIDKTDTVSFDLGRYSNRLTELEPPIVPRFMIKDMHKIDTSYYIIVDNTMAIDLDDYRKNNVYWDTVDGRKSKIVFPRKSGIGTTGIYIDSLWKIRSGVDKFNLYGINLKPYNEKLFLQALKTLKFSYPKKSNKIVNKPIGQ
jgi:hypothetical protein